MSLQCELKPNKLPIFKSKDGKTLAVNIEPTWLKLPKELGGKRVNIQEIFTAKVCKCGKHPAKVFVLERDYIAVECINQYMWIRKPNDIEAFKKIMM